MQNCAGMFNYFQLCKLSVHAMLQEKLKALIVPAQEAMNELTVHYLHNPQELARSRQKCIDISCIISHAWLFGEYHAVASTGPIQLRQ